MLLNLLPDGSKMLEAGELPHKHLSSCKAQQAHDSSTVSWFLFRLGPLMQNISFEILGKVFKGVVKHVKNYMYLLPC